MQRTTKTNDLFAPWTQAQQTLWERWRAAMANGATPATGMGNTPIAFWKAAIYGSLEFQLAAAEAWKAWICANDANIPELSRGACQTVHFFEDWTRTQMQLWEGWFAALERAAPSVAKRPADATQEGVKARSHEHARRHDMPAQTQPHDNVPV